MDISRPSTPTDEASMIRVGKCPDAPYKGTVRFNDDDIIIVTPQRVSDVAKSVSDKKCPFAPFKGNARFVYDSDSD
jgi:hypothetical protein